MVCFGDRYTVSRFLGGYNERGLNMIMSFEDDFVKLVETSFFALNKVFEGRAYKDNGGSLVGVWPNDVNGQLRALLEFFSDNEMRERYDVYSGAYWSYVENGIEIKDGAVIFLIFMLRGFVFSNMIMLAMKNMVSSTRRKGK